MTTAQMIGAGTLVATVAFGLLTVASAEDLPLVPLPSRITCAGGSSCVTEIEDSEDASLKPESYRLVITPKLIRVDSCDAAGAFYARQTLAQLKRQDGSYPCVRIEDAPRFRWRGLRLNDPRHILGKKTILKTLETMAAFKMNVLQWQCGDEEIIRRAAELHIRIVTEVAATRGEQDVVMMPAEFCSFDLPQAIANDPGSYPSDGTFYLPLAKVYAFDPLKGVPKDSRRYVFGAQAGNEKEVSSDDREIEWRIWPRAAALAEVLWTYPSKRDFTAFAVRMEKCRAALVRRGVNAAPVWIHDEPGTLAGRLARTKNGNGFRYDYAQGDLHATVEMRSGTLSCTTKEGTHVFDGRNVEIDLCDLGRGAVLISGRSAKTNLCCQILLDGPRVLVKGNQDLEKENPKPPDEIRPYEFVWANRMADEFPPIARLERSDGWRVVCSNAEARLETVTNRALFGRSVVRLHYRGTDEKSEVRLAADRPIALLDAFDTTSLWVYGDNLFGKPVPSVSLSAVFTDAGGKSVIRDLGTVRHKEWHLMTSVGPRCPYGARFSELVVRGISTNGWQAIDLTSLCAFADPKRPDVTPAIDRATLPFPNRPEGMCPPRVNLSGKLSFRLPKDPIDWSDLAFRFGNSDWIPLAIGGGVFPRDAAEGAHVEFYQKGNSLICDIVCEKPGIERLQFGKIRLPAGSALYGFPYYTFRYFNQWDNSALKDAGCGLDPCFFRPKIAVVPLAGRTVFVGAALDWYCSQASGPYSVVHAEEGEAALATGLIYLPKTDGLRNACRERFVWTVSERLEDVFPVIANPKSPYLKEAGSGSWVSFPARNREKDITYWRAVKAAGMDHVIITDHEAAWRDGNESFTFRTRTAPKKGGDEGQFAYARTLIDELGFCYGPYNNFTDYAPVNEFWSIDHAGRFCDGSLIPAWNRCYSPNSTYGAMMCNILAPQIQAKFRFNAAYCDVHTAVTPWSRVDYDARHPGAGTFAQVYYDYGAIMLAQKRVWRGPVYSEGSVHWFYSGLTDGNYAQDADYDFMTEPWLVDFDLYRMHDLCCNFGMGAPYMFYRKKEERIHRETPQLWMDRFTAATLAFGHSGWFMTGRDPSNLELEKESYYPVQAIAARYTQVPVVGIEYADAHGRLFPSDKAYANGAARRSQVRLTYADGTVVAVNGNISNDFKVAVGSVNYVLPPNGWRAETADGSIVSFNGYEGGRRVKYARSPEYEWKKEDLR